MNVLIIGLGSIASKHIKALKEIDQHCKFFALRHHKDSKPKDGVINILSLDTTINFDFIIISNPTSLHAETLNKCLDLRVPVFIEKPLFHQLSEPERELIKQVNSKGIKTYIACVLRFHPLIQYLKDYLAKDNKIINEVNVYCGSFLPDWRKGQDYRKTYSANPELGGGVHLDLIHEIDYIYYLFGKPLSNHHVFASKSSLDISAIDFATYNLEYKTFYANVVLNYYRPNSKRTIEIVFNDHILEADLINGTITKNGNENLFSTKIELSELYKTQLEYFIKTANPMNDIAEAETVLKIILK